MTLKDFAITALSFPFVDKGRTEEGVDCWGIPYLCYKEVLNIELPKFTDAYIDSGLSEESRGELGRLINQEKLTWLKKDWKKVDAYEPMDIALFTLGGQLVHCGLMIDKNNFLHCEKKIGTCIERLSSPLWNRRLEGIYRLVGLCQTK